MAKTLFTLKVDKKINGKLLKKGTPIFEIIPINGATPQDIHKVILLSQVDMISDAEKAPESKSSGNKK